MNCYVIMLSSLNKTRQFMKYCYLSADYIKQDACPCLYECRMTAYCHLRIKTHELDKYSYLHNNSNAKNGLPKYFTPFKKD